MQVTLLGTGTSVGIPIIGCRCRVCTSSDPRDVRTRCSCHVQTQGLSIVIDTGPDFRQQALRENIRTIDAVLFTHHHFDHIAGVDDLRPYFFGNRTPMPCHVNKRTEHTLRRMYPWIFDAAVRYGPAPRLKLISCIGPFEVRSRYKGVGVQRVVPVALMHGRTRVLGYRMGRFAYLTDASHVPEAAVKDLGNLDVLVIDALQQQPHRKHLSIPEAIETGRRLRARETILIHMTHRVKHAEDSATLPEGFALGYDGMSFTVDPAS